MAYIYIPDTDIDFNSPTEEELLTKFRNNDEACADNPFWFEFSEITHNTSTYTKMGEFKFRFPTSAKVAAFRGEMKAITSMGYVELRINGETEKSDEQSEAAGGAYAWKTWTFSDISAHAGQEKTIEIWGKLATSGTVYFRVTGNGVSYTGRS